MLLTKAAVNFSVININCEEVALVFFRGGFYLVVVDVLILCNASSSRQVLHWSGVRTLLRVLLAPPWVASWSTGCFF